MVSLSRLICTVISLISPLKSSLKGCHKQWFYHENHEPNLPPFVRHVPTYDAMWVEEPVEFEMAIVTTLAG
jgi:hypothetical protein